MSDPSGMTMGVRGGPGSADGGPGAPGGTVTAGQKEGGGPVETVLDGNRARYLEVSPNVRRMPVGIVLVVDEAYLQDVLLAYANSPLRFQITQVHWSRFRGTLGGLGTTGPGGGEQPGITSSGSGVMGSGILPPGSGEGAPIGSPRGPRGPGGPGGIMSGMMPGGPGAGGYGGSGGGQLSTISESHLTSGLIEVCIYGIISLYEKFEVKPATADGKDAKDAGVKDTKDEKDGGAKDAKGVTPTELVPKGTTPPAKPDAPKDEKGAKPKEPAAPPEDPKGKQP